MGNGLGSGFGVEIMLDVYRETVMSVGFWPAGKTVTLL